MRNRITLWVIRGLFLLACAGIGLLIGDWLGEPGATLIPWLIILSVFVGLLLVGVEALFSRSPISTIAAIVFGLLIGFALSALFASVIEVLVNPFQSQVSPEMMDQVVRLKFLLQLTATTLFCYFGITLLLHTQDELQFIIPFVRFRPEVKGLRPILVDTSVILGDNLPGLIEAGFFESRLVIPGCVAHELQALADSSDARKRALGERGLGVLGNLVERRLVEVLPAAGETQNGVDDELIRLALKESGRILTADHKLEQRAAVEGAPTIFLPRILQALRPERRVGDELEIEIVRRGEEPHQGVGYLDDGTMVVIDQGADRVGQHARVEVRQILPTATGRILFARIAEPPGRE